MVGPWLPEPLLTGPDAATQVLMGESVSTAMLVVMENLTPAERVALVLHDVFDFPFGRIAEVLGGTPAASRKIARPRTGSASGAGGGRTARPAACPVIGTGQRPSGSSPAACSARTPPAPTVPPGCAPSTPSWKATSPAPAERAGQPVRPAAPAAPEQTCTPDRQHATEPRGAPPRNGPPAAQPPHETTR
ncbi:hypothetical protein [Nonomuraea aurantiaca]|uniref:hypothetical protein n=1 Tax=Nonomuraea aurantiaca TaxID=2878562 RepID=UPI001CDA43C1|nr:hypothetical protein [Nonomuraea aurantiaca]MCA2221105.1 hypothetical protein [Nonomuraea aurantiaca]